MNKEELVDKIVREWSWRCEKGYPDLNNPTDMKILNNLLESYVVNINNYIPEQEEKEKETDLIKDIIDLLKKNEDNEKLLTRVYRTLQASSDIPKLKKKLSDAGLTDDLFDNRHLFDEIINILLHKGDRSSISDLVNFAKAEELPNSGNVYEISNDISPEKLKKIAGLTGAKSSVAIGKGEILFPILYSDIKLKTDGAGDFTRDGKTVEVKAIGVTKEGKATAGGRFGTSRGGETYKPYNKNIKSGGFLTAITADIENAIEADPNNIDKVFKHINKYLKKIYSNSTQEISKATYEADKLHLTLKKAAVEHYIKEKKIDEFLLFNPITGDFILISPAEDLLNKLESGDVKLSTKVIPQLSSFKI